MISIIFLLFVCHTIVIDSHPTIRKQLDEIIDSNPCIKGCIQIIENGPNEISIVKTVDYGNYFKNLQRTCSLIEKARKCLNRCQVESNPFDLDYMKVICEPEILNEVKKYETCMRTKGEIIMKNCEQICGNMKNITKEIEYLTKLSIQEQNKDQQKVSNVMEKTNEACRMMKCYARCSVDGYSLECNEDAGKFVYSFIERVNQAMISDLEEQNVLEVMKQTVPAQCNYMHTPKVMFNKTADDEFLANLSVPVSTPINKLPEAQESLKTFNELADLYRKVALKEFNILEKREQLIEIETRLLNMEMELLKRKQQNEQASGF